MKKKLWGVAQIVVLAVMLMTVANSIKEIKTESAFCNGFPCMTSSECGSNCFCNYKNGMCYGATLTENE